MQGGGLFRSTSARGIRRSRFHYQLFDSLLIQPHLRGWFGSLGSLGGLLGKAALLLLG